MLTLGRILFPTDFSDLANRALDHALALAHRHEAELHLLHAVVLHADDPHDPAHLLPNAEEIRVRLEEGAARRMTSQLQERDADLRAVVRVQRRGMAAAPVILEYASEIEADVIVMSTRGRRGLGHALLGSVTEEVVRLAWCPVLTIRYGGSPPVAEPRSVLVPVDFSRHSESAAACAAKICRTYGARMHLLHVYEQPLHPEVYVGGGLAGLPSLGVVAERLRDSLREVAEQAGPDVDVDIHVREGRAVAGILAVGAEVDADLIVIATHGLTGLAHVLLGSVAERVVRRAECPVLTVKVRNTGCCNDATESRSVG